MINDETGKAWDWGREISYYHGADSDGSWSEGGRSDSSTLGQVPPGRYYLRVEPDWEAPSQTSSSPPPEPVLYTIKVKRDVPQFWYYPVILVFLFIPPLVRSVKSLRFETRRWEDSQYPPTGGGSSSDDDD